MDNPTLQLDFDDKFTITVLNDVYVRIVRSIKLKCILSVSSELYQIVIACAETMNIALSL